MTKEEFKAADEWVRHFGQRLWGVTEGCSAVSLGCDYCWARAMIQRFGGDFSKVRCFPERLDLPRHWKKPRRVFVASMSDLFHPDVPDDFILNVWQVMADTPRHIYLVLTKRSERMAEFTHKLFHYEDKKVHLARAPSFAISNPNFQQWSYQLPLPNIWLGVSIESERYLFRADDLRQANAAVRFISFEPLLGPIPINQPKFVGFPDWVIVGGESGPGARLMDPRWILTLQDWASRHRIPWFLKQFGSAYARSQGWKHPNGADMSEWPEWAKVRQFPIQTEV